MVGAIVMRVRRPLSSENDSSTSGALLLFRLLQLLRTPPLIAPRRKKQHLSTTSRWTDFFFSRNFFCWSDESSFSGKVSACFQTQLPRVRFTALPKKFAEEKIVDVAEVNRWHWLAEIGQGLENVDQTHLVLASSKPVLQKIQISLNGKSIG